MDYTILKIGGNVLNHPALLTAALDYFASLDQAVLVHGGGRKASELLSKMGIEPQMVGGRRLTDASTLEVVTMVYAGLLNKNIVAQLQARGCNALGLSGADGDVVHAHKRPVGAVDYGYAGDLDRVKAPFLAELLNKGCSPVLCPITHDGKGQLLNTNADTIAMATAEALAGLGDVQLQYCFELPGVLRDINEPDSVIPTMSSADFARYRAEGVVAGGMLPKLENAFAAIAGGVKEVVIGDLTALSTKRGTRLVDNA